MKNLMSACIVLLIVACANPKTEKQIVELSCGQCQFGLTSEKGCDLAVRIDGQSYFVDGADIDDFGDAHDEKVGFCEVIRKGEVEGEIVDNRFKVNSVKNAGIIDIAKSLKITSPKQFYIRPISY